jgi:similar to stage IV sporulation protein
VADCKLSGLELTLDKIGGFPFFLYYRRKRIGFALGALIAVLMIVSFESIIWDVRISGNETLTETEILDALEECGFGIGTSKRGFRADVLENKAMILDSRIAWMSVNVKGTVAYVQVRESQSRDEDNNKSPANLVASRSGVIQRVELKEGNLLVAAGDRVNEGDLLVSGLYDSQVEGFRYTRADAKVYARCLREISVFIPRTVEERVYGEGKEVKAEYSLNFFGKEIKFSKKCGKEECSCDIIQESKSLTLIRGISLPISINTVWHVPYSTKTVTRTDAQLEQQAYFELSMELEKIPGGVELIKKTVITSADEEGYHLECTLVCIEDIANCVECEVTRKEFL